MTTEVVYIFVEALTEAKLHIIVTSFCVQQVTVGRGLLRGAYWSEGERGEWEWREILKN